MVALVSSGAYTQALPCPSGTLANVLGTSCTIGNLTFNFQNNFQGFVGTTDLISNTFSTAPLPPNAIGFTPVSSRTQTGFLLTTNFVDNTNDTGLFLSSHSASFSYSPQVNGAFEILGESSNLVGTIGQANTTSLSAFDNQCFTNGECIQVAPAINFVPGFGLLNNPSVSATLGFPALVGTGTGGLPFTTAVDSFSFLGSEALLNSVVFLYTVVPQTPPPPPATLHYKNIDVTGEQSTFATAINNQGTIAGTLQDFSGTFHGYLTDRDGNDLTLIDFPGAAASFVNAINDKGDLVGQYNDNAGVTHGFALRDGAFTTLDFPNSIFNAPLGINNHGEISGFYQATDFGVHGYVLRDGNFTIIDDPDAFVFNGPNNVPFTITEVFSINEREDVEGFSVDANNVTHSFLLSHGVFQRIEVPAGVEGTSAFGLNDSDEIVGDFTDVNGVTHGFLMNHQALSTVDFPDAAGTSAAQINSPGRIVGTYIDSAGVIHSFLASADGLGDNAVVVSKAGAQNGGSSLKSNTPARPCTGRQPVKPDAVTGLMTCGLH